MLVVELLWPFAAGATIGAAYFASMWWTLNHLIRAKRPMLWVLGGAAVRIALVLPLFYLVMAEQWQRLLACLAGFVVVRTLTTLGRRGGMPPATRTAG
ncbi:MAG: N-ATPase subunit AtpR [Rhodoplanes sp.]|jgi:F1F0 ATPase subunit 2